jgi:hypothetical protein
MNRSSKGWAVITGASSGIGEAFARRLAADGYDLIIVARRVELLEKLAQELSRAHGVSAEVEAADLSVEGDVARVAERIKVTPRLAMLVNNAGFSTAERFIDADLESQLRMCYVHNMATLWLTHSAIKGMKARGEGSIINVSSIGGLIPAPYNATYDATKAFLVLFSEALQRELQGTGVKVQALCPGFTRTGFHEAIGVERDVPERFWQSPAEVVDASLADLAKGRVVCIPGKAQRLFISFLLSLPRSLRYRLVRLVEG